MNGRQSFYQIERREHMERREPSEIIERMDELLKETEGEEQDDVLGVIAREHVKNVRQHTETN